MSNVELVLTAQNEFITKYSKTLYFVDVFHFNSLAYDHNPAIGELKIAGFSRWRQGWVEPKFMG